MMFYSPSRPHSILPSQSLSLSSSRPPIFLLTCLLCCFPARGLLLLFIIITPSPSFSFHLLAPAFLQSLLSLSYPQGSLMNKPYPAMLGRSPDDAHNRQNVAIVAFLGCVDTTVSLENISFPIFTFPKPNFC